MLIILVTLLPGTLIIQDDNIMIMWNIIMAGVLMIMEVTAPAVGDTTSCDGDQVR